MALVETPHIGGVLKLYRYTEGDPVLRLETEAPGFSNHVLGSMELGMSAVVDVNADGVPDLIVPSADRKALRVVTAASGLIEDLMALNLPEPIVTALQPVDLDDDGRIEFIFYTAEGQRHIVRFVAD